MGNVSDSRSLNATRTVPQPRRPFTSTLKRFLQPQPAAPKPIDVRQLCEELTEVGLPGHVHPDHDRLPGREVDLIGCPTEQFIVLWRRSPLVSDHR
jgi:hypothetical protein